MGVSNLNAEMLLASYFQAPILSEYARRIGKSDKGGAATLAERIAREWAKPSFAPPSAGSARKRAAAEEPAEDAASKRISALVEIKAKRAKQAAKQAAIASAATSAPAPSTTVADVSFSGASMPVPPAETWDGHQTSRECDGSSASPQPSHSQDQED